MRSEQEIFGGYELVFLIMHICWFRKQSNFIRDCTDTKNGPSAGIVYQVVAFRGKNNYLGCFFNNAHLLVLEAFLFWLQHWIKVTSIFY